jgi:hypothetical protein
METGRDDLTRAVVGGSNCTKTSHPADGLSDLSRPSSPLQLRESLKKHARSALAFFQSLKGSLSHA